MIISKYFFYFSFLHILQVFWQNPHYLFSWSFFSKKRINLKENNIYAKLIIVNFIGIILEIFCTIFAGYIENHLLFYTILNKLFLLYLITWNTIFTLYVFYVTLINDNKPSKKLNKIFISIYILFSLITIILPLQFKVENGYVMYSYGPAVNIVYIFIILVITSMIICILKNNKKIKNKKYLPLYIFIFLGSVTGFIQMNYPELLLATFMETFITVIMYFTIENPDKKLLEEIHLSKKRADAANEDKSMLIYNMMNDVKTVAGEINKSSEIILNSNNLEEDKYYAREIISSNNKLYSMANNIYNIDVIDNINIKTVNNKYNIKLLFKEIISKYKDLYNNKNIDFRFNIDSNIPEYLYGDSINLKNVLNTILSNSYKYTIKGYVELSVNTILKKDIARLIIKIEDSGIGIKDEDIDKCLNKNTKEENTLYGARKIINILGGSLLINSEYNKGTIVTIILDQKIYNSSKDNYDNYVNNKKILIIENNNTTVKLINKILDKHNILYDNISVSKEALDKIRKGTKYDLILLEEDMPYINGISLMNKLSKIKGFNAKVILLTKNNNIIYDDIYKDSNFIEYITKPIDKDDLMNKINKYLK